MMQFNLNFLSTKAGVRWVFRVFCAVVILTSLVGGVTAEETLVLERERFVILLPSSEPEPVKQAVKSLVRDFKTVMEIEPEVIDHVRHAKGRILLAVVNDASSLKVSLAKGELQPLPPLDGFESHRVLVDHSLRTVYLHGNDLRGTIYAIYTFSEQILGVPPLWYFCSWKPVKKERIVIPANTNLFFESPQVRYRAWFPNDTDMFSPWRKLSEENDTQWLETMLRLKLNTVECSTTIRYPGRMNTTAEMLARYGLVITSHHMIALNSSFTQWEEYWKTVRKEPAPALSLANEKEVVAFYRYNIETVHASGMENLWQIAFRGDGDKPFWATFPDAPASEPDRAAVINRMLRIQLDLIKEITGEKAPYVRMTFYDELSDLLANGLLQPPQEPNMIWTFCSARRDHYPNDDLVNFSPKQEVKLGYYMNLQFSSTGSHLAPAEGPWKMEDNYRYVNKKAPLYFSVLNAGNVREHLLGLSANAALLWNFDDYQTDRFVQEYCEKYFGKQYAPEIATLYKDFFAAYWQPTASRFPGMERQFLFQDQRYARAFRMIGQTFFEFTPEPLRDIGFERMPGRTFRISPKDNQAENTVDAILHGMKVAIPRFARVAQQSEEMERKLSEEYRLFFYDNLGGYARFMAHLSHSFYHYVTAYKEQSNLAEQIKSLELSLTAMQLAREALLRNQHGVFKTWYDGDAATSGKFNMPAVISQIEKTLSKAATIKSKTQFSKPIFQQSSILQVPYFMEDAGETPAFPVVFENRPQVIKLTSSTEEIIVCEGPGPCILPPREGESSENNFAERNPLVTSPKIAEKSIDLTKEPWFVESSNLPINHPALNRERMIWAESLLWVPLTDVLPEILVERWVTNPPKDMAGKYVLIEAWASWCPPCRRSLSYLNFIQEKYCDQLVVILISETDEEDIRSMPGELNIEDFKFSLAVDTGRRFANRLKVFGVPHAILLEPMLGGVVWEGMPTLPKYELSDKVLEKFFVIGKRLSEQGQLPKESPISFRLQEATEEERATRRKNKSKKDAEGIDGGPSLPDGVNQ